MRALVDAFRRSRTPAECGQDAWNDEFTAEEVGPWSWHFMAARGAGLEVRHVGFRRWEVRPTWFARWRRGNFRIRMVIDCGTVREEAAVLYAGGALSAGTANPEGFIGYYPSTEGDEWVQCVGDLATGLREVLEWWLVYTPRRLRSDIRDVRAWNREEAGATA